MVKLDSNLVTKSDLAVALAGLEQNLEEKIVGKIVKSNDKVIESNLRLVTELEKYREENKMHDVSHKRMDDTLLRHGDRLTQLEQAS